VRRVCRGVPRWIASGLRAVAGLAIWARIRTGGSRPIKSIWSSTAGSRETASGAYLASARKDSISVRTEPAQPVSARSSSQPRSAGDSGSAWARLTTAAGSRQIISAHRHDRGPIPPLRSRRLGSPGPVAQSRTAPTARVRPGTGSERLRPGTVRPSLAASVINAGRTAGGAVSHSLTRSRYLHPYIRFRQRGAAGTSGAVARRPALSGSVAPRPRKIRCAPGRIAAPQNQKPQRNLRRGPGWRPLR
jgi:hypothetical protein